MDRSSWSIWTVIQYYCCKSNYYCLDADDANYNKKLAFKNNAPFISCISKMDHTLNVNAEDLDIVMPMYNLIEYSKIYSKTLGGLWNF